MHEKYIRCNKYLENPMTGISDCGSIADPLSTPGNSYRGLILNKDSDAGLRPNR
jgi:hypothetical protein